MSDPRVGRTYTTPRELFDELEEIARESGTNLNQVCVEGFELWLKRYKRRLKDQEKISA